MSSSEVAIEIEDLSKCYSIYRRPIDRMLSRWFPSKKRDFWALKNVSLTIRKGETVAIIGRNGSGKSTLLQVVCGTLNPTHGSVHVRGRIAALLELGAGFDLESTGRENVFINGMLLGMSSDEIKAKFDDIERFADIGEFVDQPVKTYSSGMFVRLAFAVIAHCEPDILIIDEALAVGDVFFVQKCMRFIRDFKERGTILFVSHDTTAVTNLCDRAAWLSEGQLKMIGAAKEVSEHYLAYQHSRDRRLESGENVAIRQTKKNELRSVPTDFPDCRHDLLQTTTLRNDIKIVAIGDPDNGFGTGKACIEAVSLTSSGASIQSLIGGELVQLSIDVCALADLTEVIAGFYFKDRLGQQLFGDNTYLISLDNTIDMKKNERVTAVFEFRMPILPPGDYTIDVAFASGTQENHTQHHWIHDALAVKSINSSIVTGLVGVPMKKINIRKV